MPTYTVLVYEAEPEEGGFWANVAELPGCYTSGESVEEIRTNILDAIDEYIHAHKVMGKELPPRVFQTFEVSVDEVTQ